MQHIVNSAEAHYNPFFEPPIPPIHVIHEPELVEYPIQNPYYHHDDYMHSMDFVEHEPQMYGPANHWMVDQEMREPEHTHEVFINEDHYPHHNDKKVTKELMKEIKE